MKAPPVDLGARAVPWPCAIWRAWSVVAVNLPALGFKLLDQPAVHIDAAQSFVGRHAAHLLFQLHGAGVPADTALDSAVHGLAHKSSHRHRLYAVRDNTTGYPPCGAGAAVRLGEGATSSFQRGQHQLQR